MGVVKVAYNITINQSVSRLKSMSCNPHKFFSAFFSFPLGVTGRLEGTGVV